MSVTGTGTKEDPFIIDTYDEFMAKLNINNFSGIGGSVYYISIPEGTVWDLNEIYPEGVYQTNAGYNKDKGLGIGYVIYGNGLIIKNLYCKGTYWLYLNVKYNTNNQFEMYDVHFQNMHLDGGLIKIFPQSSGDGYTDYSFFYGCTFSGISNYSSNTIGIFDTHQNSYQPAYHSRIYFRVSPNTKLGCGFQIESPNAPLFHRPGNSHPSEVTAFQLEYAHIIFNGNYLFYGNGVCNAWFIGCLVEGKCKLGLMADSGKIGGLTSIFDITDISNQNINSYWGNDNENPLMIFNRDKMSYYSDPARTNPHGFIGVTTEQLTDVEFLRSLGFPAG